MPSIRRSPSPQSQVPQLDFPTAMSNTMVQPQHSPFFAGWTLLPLRLFLGITFVYAGVQKLTDPQFFHTSTPSYIGNQLIAFAHGSPLHDLIIKMAVPHAVLFGYAVAFGEIAIGLGALFGLLFRPAAFFGLILSLIFFLTASWRVYPYFYGADIVFAFCWLVLLLHGPVATGYPALDTWLMTKLFPSELSASGNIERGIRSSSPPHPLAAYGKFFRILLIGSPDMPQTAIPPDTNYGPMGLHTSSQQSSAQQHMRAIVQRKREARRNFLLGTITGMSTIVGIGVVAFVVNSLFSDGQNSTTPSTTQTNTYPTPPDTIQNGNPPPATGGTVIAQVSAVAKNASTTFTIPSSGDPGVLIHLPNGQFVAYDATCTHAGCQVDYDPASHHIICPCHGATFDPAQRAAVLDGPTDTPLTPVAIHIDSATGSILLQ